MAPPAAAAPATRNNEQKIHRPRVDGVNVDAGSRFCDHRISEMRFDWEADFVFIYFSFFFWFVWLFTTRVFRKIWRFVTRKGAGVFGITDPTYAKASARQVARISRTTANQKHRRERKKDSKQKIAKETKMTFSPR